MNMLRERLLVGVDFSKNRADIALMDSSGEWIEKHRGFANNQVGFEQAKEMLLAVLQKQSYASFSLAGEATSYYWLPMFTAFSKDQELLKFAPVQYLTNARWVRKFKESKSPQHKNDKMDPMEIADYLRFNRKLLPWNYDPHWLKLRFYTRLRFHLVKSLTREKNLFDLYLFLAHTPYVQHRPFSDPLGQTSRKLLKDPDLLEELEDLSVEEIADKLHELSHGTLHNSTRNAERLKKVLQESFSVDEPLMEPIQRGLELLISTIEGLETRIAQVEEWIIELTNSGDYPEIARLASIPGIGIILASSIAAEIGDFHRFLDVEVWDDKLKCTRLRRPKEATTALAKYCGLWWKENSSGQFTSEERRMSREGNSYLRYFILLAGECMRQRIPSFARYYQLKYAETSKHRHKRALVLTGTKVLDLVAALLRHQTFYQAKEGDVHLDQ
jgi:hypothetical protein